MAICRFKDLCIDADDTALMGRFWASVLGRHYEPDADGDSRIVGSTQHHTLWVNRVPEPKLVKHRVHFNVYARSLADLQALGATVVREKGDGRTWTVMADPEGGEFCAFVRSDPPEDRFADLVVDCADPGSLARWWGVVLDTPATDDPAGYSYVRGVPGMPVRSFDFVPVPEEKSTKNRVHWDVLVDDLDPLIASGARLVRPSDGEIRWHVMADPEGNEFSAFVERA